MHNPKDTLIGGMFCENDEEIGEIIDQVPQKGRVIRQMGQQKAIETPDGVKITINGTFVAGGRADGTVDVHEVKIGKKKVKVSVETARPKKDGTTDIVLREIA